MYKYAQLLYNLATSTRKGLAMEPTDSAAQFFGFWQLLKELVSATAGCSNPLFFMHDRGPTECEFVIAWEDGEAAGGRVRLAHPDLYKLIDDAIKQFGEIHPERLKMVFDRRAYFITKECMEGAAKRSGVRSTVTFGVGT